MVTGIIIAFEYRCSANTSRLTGVINDMVLVYKYSHKICDKLYVISDIEERVLRTVLEANKSSCKETPIVIYRVVDVQTLADTMNSISIQGDKLLIYYSGHGVLTYKSTERSLINIAKGEAILLPDNSKLSFRRFRDIILDKLTVKSQVLFILDCCNPSSLSLPYVLNDNGYLNLRNETVQTIPLPKREKVNREKFFYTSHRIIVLASTRTRGQSISTINGSVFTQSLFKETGTLDEELLTLKSISVKFNKLSSNIKAIFNRYESFCVYTSHPHITKLWNWLTRCGYQK